MHSPTHALTHPCTHPRTHPINHPPTHSLTHSPTHSLTHSPTHSLTHSLTHHADFREERLQTHQMGPLRLQSRVVRAQNMIALFAPRPVTNMSLWAAIPIGYSYWWNWDDYMWEKGVREGIYYTTEVACSIRAICVVTIVKWIDD